MTEQFQRPAHGDLRVNVAPDPMKSEITLFQEMKFEDWPDAKVKDAFDYLYNCKHCRIGWVILVSSHLYQKLSPFHAKSIPIWSSIIHTLEDSRRMAASDPKIQGRMGCLAYISTYFNTHPGLIRLSLRVLFDIHKVTWWRFPKDLAESTSGWCFSLHGACF